MKDLGRTLKEMYPSATDAKDKKQYPRIYVHKSILGDKKASMDDVHHIHIKAKIVGQQSDSDELQMEILEGEPMETPKEEEKEGETVLGKS